MKTKICNKCKIEKPIEDFHLKKNGQPIWVCKKCGNKYYKERHLKALEYPQYREKED